MANPCKMAKVKQLAAEARIPRSARYLVILLSHQTQASVN